MNSKHIVRLKALLDTFVRAEPRAEPLLESWHAVVRALPYRFVRPDQANTKLYLQLIAEFSQKAADDLWRELDWSIAANAMSCCNDPGIHLTMLQFKQALDRVRPPSKPSAPRFWWDPARGGIDSWVLPSGDGMHARAVGEGDGECVGVVCGLEWGLSDWDCDRPDRSGLGLRPRVPRGRLVRRRQERSLGRSVRARPGHPTRLPRISPRPKFSSVTSKHRRRRSERSGCGAWVGSEWSERKTQA